MKWRGPVNDFMTAEVGPGEPVDRAMIELCQKINTHVIPKNNGVAWNYLRVELWPDSGRIIVFPASTSTPNRIEKAGCQAIISDLLSEYDRIADAVLDDVAFESAVILEGEKWMERFLDAARKVGPFGIRIQCWDSDADQPTFDEII